MTGGARGLGNLFARTFVESGSNSIVIVDLIEEQAQKAAEELTAWFVEHGEAQPDEIQAVGVRVAVGWARADRVSSDATSATRTRSSTRCSGSSTSLAA